MTVKRRNSSLEKEKKPSNKKSKKGTSLKVSFSNLYRDFLENEGTLGGSQHEGAVSEIVWPFLKECNQNDEEWSNACKLLSFLVVNQEGRSSARNFDNMEKLRQVLTSLFYDSDSEDNPETIQFCSILLESKAPREVVLSLITDVNLLHWIPKRRLELELKKSASLRRSFSQAKSKPKINWTNEWINSLLQYFEGEKVSIQELNEEESTENSRSVLEYLHRSLELLIDLLSAFDSRQFLVLYLNSINFTVRCQFSLNATSFQRQHLLQQLLLRVYRLIDFPVGCFDRSPRSKSEIISNYHSRATIFQKLCHRYYLDDTEEVVYAGVGLLCNGSFLPRALGGLPDSKLTDLLHRLRLLDKNGCKNERDYQMAILLHYLTPPPYPLDRLRNFPVYPSERVLFDRSLIPPGTLLRRIPPLATSKLQIQFLSYLDYLLRNFELVRLESAYEIRCDLVDVIKRLKPVVRQAIKEESNEVFLKTDFTGWARMALEIDEPLRIVRVTPPKLGENIPARVIGEFTVDLVHCGDSIREEWDGLGEFDTLFLVSIDANKMTNAPAPSLKELERSFNVKINDDCDGQIPDNEDDTFPERFGITAIRGCMVLTIRDENGNSIKDSIPDETQDKEGNGGTKRTFTVELDSAQFAYDSKAKNGTGIYQSLNLVVRRHGKENNFRAVLESIRGLMEGSGSINRVIPSWLQPIILGYGDPKSATYSSSAIRSYALKTPGVAKPNAYLDFGDTFLDKNHVIESFPGNQVVIENEDKAIKSLKSDRHNYKVRFLGNEITASICTFPSNIKGNPVRFTPIQVEAIKSGLSLGLTLVVGPPGTGKSDVAVQIIANLYHSFPNQRTVIITHSNAALNDLFQKILARGDIEERYFIRLGSGERDLDVDSAHNFSRVGRVSHSLERRSTLLNKVQELSESMGISKKEERGADGSSSYTCESAKYFYDYHVKRTVEKFMDITKFSKGMDKVENFPFSAFFHLEEGNDGNTMTLNDAQEKLKCIDDIFFELEEYRPLELLKSQRQRTDYLLMKQAKIVAMTCTHAAIARSRLIKMGFQYDNIVMEEAGQMTEVEAFIPLLLQRGEMDVAVSRLKRICFIGDHNQLPPVIKNLTFARFSNLDRSLFARLIDFGVPYIQLDRQGRTRSEIAELYRWRYNNLGDLHHVVNSAEYSVCNAGFVHTHQFINIDDHNGKGETSPTSYYYQNLGEAEFAVALFQFMLMIGYPSSKISILTTYNGQKELITDVLNQRCGKDTPYGGLVPKSVSTVDQYQGQQNDYIILSLVRTLSAGYLRDIRRCIVAMSRARLGLYVLGRQSLFESCHEWKIVMELFSKIPSKLEIVLGEHFPGERGSNEEIPDKKFEISDLFHLVAIVNNMQSQWTSETESSMQ